MNYKSLGDWLGHAVIIYIPLSLVTPIVMYQWRDNNRLILMDQSNSYHITDYSNDTQLREIYSYNIRQAVTGFLMRNPKGLDNLELFNTLFVSLAKEKALKQIDSEKDQFEKYGMHQKAEILNIRIVRADKRRSFASVEGQLIRFYVTQTNKYTYTVKFDLTLEMTINHNLQDNGRYPFLVTGMKYEQAKIKEERI